MQVPFYRIKSLGKGFLATMARPYAGEWMDDEFTRLKQQGIDCVVSFLCEDEAERLGLATEAQACAKHDIEFISFPIIDRHVPQDVSASVALARTLHDKIHTGGGVVVHCFAGIGRSSLIAASVLLLNGYTVDDAFALISEKRAYPVPDTEQQVQWLVQHADRFVFNNP